MRILPTRKRCGKKPKALHAIALGQPVTWTLLVAAVLMAVGVWLHLTERHEHAHTHDAITHTHPHCPDAHHRPRHPKPV
jgi:hypothetical protein